MKTNHRRKYVDPGYGYNGYIIGSFRGKTPLSDHHVGACATCGDHSNGKHGIAKDRKGAKKFVASRTRFHENQALKQLVKFL